MYVVYLIDTLLIREWPTIRALLRLTNATLKTAKTLDLMYCMSPLSSVVARGSPSAPEPTKFFRDSLMNIVGLDEDIKNGGVSTRDISGGNNPFEEAKEVGSEEEVKFTPDEARGSRGNTASAPEVEDQSLSLKTVDHPVADPLVDPPADLEIPDDYPNEHEIRKSIGDSLTVDGSALNSIVGNEEEAPTGEDTICNSGSKNMEPDLTEEPLAEKNVGSSVHDYCDVKNESGNIEDPSGVKEDLPPSETYCESNELDSELNSEQNGEIVLAGHESISFTESKEPAAESSDVNGSNEDVAESTTEESATTQLVSSVSPEKEYFKSVSPHAPWSGTSKQSYYDVQELLFRETSKYVDQHKNLVKYVEDWERILFQRVHGLYTEYMKQRKNLQHYIKKVSVLHLSDVLVQIDFSIPSTISQLEQLKREMEKLEKLSEEKEKPINPKKVEKLDRNKVKLVGAREAHDKSGESLYLYLDEVANRSWRDVYPLLQRTMKFDQDVSAMQAKICIRLNGTAELLDLVGKNEAISATSRLQSLQTLHPEVIYTGGASK